jgi:hypothetical protein
MPTIIMRWAASLAKATSARVPAGSRCSPITCKPVRAEAYRLDSEKRWSGEVASANSTSCRFMA